MYKLFYQKLPQELTPTIKSNNAKILEFDNDNGTGLKSQIRCMTAGTSGGGVEAQYTTYTLASLRFGAVTNGKHSTALCKQFQIRQDSMVIVESTANGFDEFQELWQKSINGENDFKPVFIAWFELPEYRMKGEIELTEQEQQLKGKGLT